MEDNSKSMKERLEALSTDAPKDLEQLKSMSEEEQRMAANNGIGPKETGMVIQGDITIVSGDITIVSYDRIMSDFPSHKDSEGKFKLLGNTFHLEVVDDSIQLFENGELAGVMFSGDALELDFGKQIAKVINYPIKDNSKDLTFGQKAVGLTFNPSGDPRVVKAKQLMADAIDLLEEVHQEKTNNGAASSTWFRNVFRTEAFNQLVNASSSLVKYLTWQD